MANENKVVDKNTSAVWISDKNHNATTFNNHEVVRLTAEIMSKAQQKHNINATTKNAKRYIMSLVNNDLKTNYDVSEFTAPIREQTPQAPQVAPQVAQIPQVATTDTTPAPQIPQTPKAPQIPKALINGIDDNTTKDTLNFIKSSFPEYKPELRQTLAQYGWTKEQTDALILLAYPKAFK